MSNSNNDSEKGTLKCEDNTIDWKDMIKKEGKRLYKEDDLGGVQEIGQEFFVTERVKIKK